VLIRWVALGVSLVGVRGHAGDLGGASTPRSPSFQLVERAAWIPAFGIDYYLGVDGISLLLVVLTGFLTPIALLSSWESVERKVKEFSIFMLVLEAAMIGVFLSLDLFLFYVFWDAMLIPMYFLIGIWGYDQRIYAAIKFMLYTMAGSVLMLVAILGLAYLHSEATGFYSFDLLRLYALDVAPATQWWFFLAFTLAFAIKVPLFPFHTWLPDAHVQAPTAGSIILAGVLLKMGTYGLVRFSFPLFPTRPPSSRPGLRARGHRHRVRGARGDGAARHEEAGGLLVGEPPRLRRARHLRHERAGRAGRGLPDAGARHQHRRALPHRRHAVRSPAHAAHQRVRRPQAVMPRLTAAFLIITLASIGMPGLNGFVGEFLTMLGAFRWEPRFVSSPALASSCRPSTCCGCSSASTTVP
jgi:NADH-quinone oxidoreductase subunit M